MALSARQANRSSSASAWAVAREVSAALRQAVEQRVVQLALELQRVVVRAGDARFHFLELRGDEALGIRQRLLANPAEAIQVVGNAFGAAGLTLVIVGRLRALGEADFEVVAENLVVADAGAADAGALALAHLERGDPLAGIAGELAVLVQLGGDPFSNHARVENRRAILDRGADVGDHLGGVVRAETPPAGRAGH